MLERDGGKGAQPEHRRARPAHLLAALEQESGKQDKGCSCPQNDPREQVDRTCARSPERTGLQGLPFFVALDFIIIDKRKSWFILHCSLKKKR